MSSAAKTHIAWLAGMLIAALLLCVVFCVCDVLYDSNDDASILREYMGDASVQPQLYHRFIEPWLTALLIALHAIAPGVAWFSWWQLAMLWLSATVIIKSACCVAARAERPMALGAALGTVFVVGCCMYAYARPTFTTTAAMLGTAAVAQAAGMDPRGTDARTFRGWLMCWTLLVCCAVTRVESAIVSLAFCGIVFVVRLLERSGRLNGEKRTQRPLLRAVCVAAALAVAMVATRAIVSAPKEIQDYEHWQDAQSRLMDYHDLADLTPEEYQAKGWTKEELQLIISWYLLDENISTETMDAFCDTLDSRVSVSAELQSAESQIVKFWNGNQDELPSMAAMLCLLAACLLGLGRRKAPALRLLLLLATAAAVGMLALLALMGRLPLRAVLTVLLPASAISFVLAPECLPPLRSARGVICRATCLAAAVLCALTASRTYAICRKPTEEELLEAPARVYEELDDYAAYESDKLIIYGYELFFDYRLFPRNEGGLPQNIVFWGGWETHSPRAKEQFARFGIDEDHFTADDFLRENVYYATGIVDPPPTELLEYIQSMHPDKDIQCDLMDTSGSLYFFQFWVNEDA